jgi:hypothetical protein
MASIRDYWYDQTVESITELLHEYNNLFPTTFTEMKGIVGELGEMRNHSYLKKYRSDSDHTD